MKSIDSPPYRHTPCGLGVVLFRPDVTARI